MSFLKPNQSYNASLTADYTAGDATLSVNTIPTNTPSVVTVARGTAKETRFTFTGTSSGLLTGVTRLDGANENIPSGVSVECMIDADFINQLSSAVFDQAGLKGLVYAADGGSNDTYAITLPVAPASLSDITGLPLIFKANTANTGAATLNVNALGAKTIKKNHDQDLVDNDIESGQIVTVVYDGTNFQMQSQVAIPADVYVADAGANDSYAITVGNIPAYVTGATLKFKANTANTGAATLNVNSLGAKTIKKLHDQDLADNDIESGQIVTVVYDGTNFQMQSQLANSASVVSDGWTADANTWTYASASTFTIAGVDLTAIFVKGTRLKFTNSGSKYAVVVGSSFSTNTTVTIAVNSDYTIANAAISGNYYSYQLCPAGYPTWFNYAPTHTGFSVNPSGFPCKYKIDGSNLTINYTCLYQAGTSNATGYTISIPVTSDSNQWTTSILFKDNSSYGTVPGTATIGSGATTISFYKDIVQSAWTTSGGKGVALHGFVVPF